MGENNMIQVNTVTTLATQTASYVQCCEKRGRTTRDEEIADDI
jgi:hypothetical protein